MKFSRADSRVKMWFSDVSGTNFVLIFKVSWWFGRTRAEYLVSYPLLCISPLVQARDGMRPFKVQNVSQKLSSNFRGTERPTT